MGGPVTLKATIPGTGTGSVNGKLSFDPKIQNQRPALTLVNGTIYIASASFGDKFDYHGWVLGYNARTLKQTVVYNDTANGEEGGIWMAGSGLTADSSGNVFVSTGNGTFDGKTNLSDSVLKLTPTRNRQLKVLDSFTPKDQQHLIDNDLDFGSAGVTLLPDQPGAHKHLAVTAGKEGVIYLLDRDHLGGFANPDNVVQEVNGVITALFNTPAYYNGHVYLAGMTSSNIYSQKKSAVLMDFKLSNGLLSTTPTVAGPAYNYPGATPVVSANGATNGIVWTVAKDAANGNNAVLHAYDANDISRELYNSSEAITFGQVATSDQAGVFNKFTPPVVVNGKVYVAGQGSLTLYGLLPGT